MLKGQYTRAELGVKRGNIQWKVTVDDVKQLAEEMFRKENMEITILGAVESLRI